MNPFPFIILIILSIYLSMVYTLFEFDSKNDKTDSILTCISFYLMMINFSILLLLVYTLYPYLSIYFLIGTVIVYGYVYYLIIEKLVKIFILKRNDSFQLKIMNSFFKLYPILSVLTFFIQIKVTKPQKVSEKDIREMITASSESGNLEEPQKEYIENIF